MTLAADVIPVGIEIGFSIPGLVRRRRAAEFRVPFLMVVVVTLLATMMLMIRPCLLLVMFRRQFLGDLSPPLAHFVSP